MGKKMRKTESTNYFEILNFPFSRILACKILPLGLVLSEN